MSSTLGKPERSQFLSDAAYRAALKNYFLDEARGNLESSSEAVTGTTKGTFLTRFFRFLKFSISLPILIPLIALFSLRLATELYHDGYTSATLIIILSVVVAIFSFSILFGIGLRLITKSFHFKRVLKLTAILTTAATVYGLVYIGSQNLKTESIKSEFNEVHPILRLGVSFWLLADKQLVLTDMSRVSDDYEQMGLNKLQHSLHYPQADGWVHAVDLRTKNRPEWLNKSVEAYFSWMGFKCLRHVGTADHLHISLPLNK